MANAELNAQTLFDEAVAAHVAGDLATAIVGYRRVIALDPTMTSAYGNLGTALRLSGQPAEAVDCYRVVTEQRPSDPEAYYNLGTGYQSCGDATSAVRAYQRALELGPAHSRAHYNLGILLFQMGDLQQALVHFRRASDLDPQFTAAWINLGVALRDNGDLAGAVQALQRALELAPGHERAACELGLCRNALGDFDQAVPLFQQALARRDHYLEALLGLGLALTKLKRMPEAETMLDKALALAPDHPLCLRYYGMFCIEANRLKAAKQALQASLAQMPDDGIEALATLLVPSIMEGYDQIRQTREQLVGGLQRLIDRDLSLQDPVEQVGLTSFYTAYHGVDERPIQELTARFYRQACPDLAYTAEHCRDRRWTDQLATRRLRVGFASVFFFDHTIGKLNRGLIEHLDRNRFEVTTFQIGPRDDAMAQRIAGAADHNFRLERDLPTVRKTIADQRLDVLIYTDIGMDPYTYFLAHARLAPVQCVTWGHPVTTGMPSMDYFLSGQDLEASDADAHYIERLVRWPVLGNYYYRPEDPGNSLDRAAFGLRDDWHVYVCPQTLFKFHPDFDTILAEILQRDPKGRIVLIDGPTPDWQQQLKHRWLPILGKDLDRIVWLKPQPLARFLRLLQLSDVMLDPPHFGGGNTSYEAFAFGVPIVTWPSGFLRGRITYAQYRQMGIADGIVNDLQDYASRAVALATDGSRRQALRQAILANGDRLFERREAVQQLEAFLQSAVTAAAAP